MHTGAKGAAAPQSFSAHERGRRRGERVDMRRRGHDDFLGEGRATGADSEGYVTRAVNRQKVMNTLEMEEWRKVWGNKKLKVARPNDKLVVGARIIYKRKMKDGEVEKCKYRLTWKVEGVHYSPTPAAA